MKQQHTPGPWKTEQRTTKGEFVTETHIVASDGSHIAEVSPCQIEENARLIAAAPDLLGACNAALVAIDSIMPPEERGDSASDKLRAAIARAKGE